MYGRPDGRTCISPSVTIFFASFLGGINNGFNSGLTNGIVPRLEHILDLTNTEEGILNASLFCGGVVGCLAGAILNDYKGRRWTTVFGEVVIILGTSGQLLQEDLWTISTFRIIAGFGFGICAVTKPLYVSELADTKNRGFFVATFCVAFSLGILLVLVCEALAPPVDDTAGYKGEVWRIEIALCGIPAVALLTLVTFALPESPVWLELERRRVRKNAETVVGATANVDDAEEGGGGEASKLVTKPASAADTQKAFYYASLATLMMSIVHQMTLIAIVMGLTRQYIERVDVPNDESDVWVFVVSGSHLAGVLVALPLIDSVGRRPLLFTGYSVMAVSLMALAGVEMLVAGGGNSIWGVKLFLICVFVFGFQIGPSPTYYTLISELFPYDYRALGNGFGTIMIFIWCIVVMAVYPSTKDNVSIEAIALFSLVVILTNGIVLWFLLPETQGVPLDKITLLWVRHLAGKDASCTPSLLLEPQPKRKNSADKE